MQGKVFCGGGERITLATDEIIKRKETKWLVFELIERKQKTLVYSVISKCSNDRLGLIKWYPSWRHYCFFPTKDFESVYSDRCLFSLSGFVSYLNEQHKNLKKEARG